MVICAVFGCFLRSDRKKGSSSSVQFYRLPSIISHQGPRTLELSKERQLLWLSRLGRADITPDNYQNCRVCSKHFVTGKPSELYDNLNQDWAPSLHLTPESAASPISNAEGSAQSTAVSNAGSVQSTARYDRMKAREAKRRHMDDDESDNIERSVSPDGPAADHEYSLQMAFAFCVDMLKAANTSLGLFNKEVTELRKKSEELSKKNAELIKENADLKNETSSLQNKLDEVLLSKQFFINRDDRVRYYTGLTSWPLLNSIFCFVQSAMSHDQGHTALPPFEQLILTLVRLRLSLSGQDLAYRFNVHPSTVSRIFVDVLYVLYEKLKFLILWPERETLRETLPVDFRKHCPKCAVIIDCFEIFIDRPSDLMARAQTYSHYKHHNTVKYLIGITPQGSVSYISCGWGGRASDKYITENCGILNKIIPGDTILADRGFDIKDSIGIYCATVQIPNFTRGKKQLTGIEVEQTRGIANVRIHVERVIGNIKKKYLFLNDTQPIDYLIAKHHVPPVIDMAVTVGCCLCNLCDSVIPFD